MMIKKLLKNTVRVHFYKNYRKANYIICDIMNFVLKCIKVESSGKLTLHAKHVVYSTTINKSNIVTLLYVQRMYI